MTNELYSEILTNLNNLKFDNRAAYEYFGAMRDWLINDLDTTNLDFLAFNQLLVEAA